MPDLVTTGSNSLMVSQECALAAKMTNHVLGYIKHNTTSWLKEVILPMYWLVQPHFEYCVQFWALCILYTRVCVCVCV